MATLTKVPTAFEFNLQVSQKDLETIRVALLHANDVVGGAFEHYQELYDVITEQAIALGLKE